MRSSGLARPPYHDGSLSSSFRYYASVSTAINGDINGKNAVPTRPSAATAMAPNSKDSNISFHLLSFPIQVLSVRMRTDKPHIRELVYSL